MRRWRGKARAKPIIEIACTTSTPVSAARSHRRCTASPRSSWQHVAGAEDARGPRGQPPVRRSRQRTARPGRTRTAVPITTRAAPAGRGRLGVADRGTLAALMRPSARSGGQAPAATVAAPSSTRCREAHACGEWDKDSSSKGPCAPKSVAAARRPPAPTGSAGWPGPGASRSAGRRSRSGPGIDRADLATRRLARTWPRCSHPPSTPGVGGPRGVDDGARRHLGLVDRGDRPSLVAACRDRTHSNCGVLTPGISTMRDVHVAVLVDQFGAQRFGEPSNRVLGAAVGGSAAGCRGRPRAEPTWTIVPRSRGSIRRSAARVPWT